MLCSICMSPRHRAASCPKRIIQLGWISILLMLTVLPGRALAHSWYPIECCSANDCAPADKVESVQQFNAGIFGTPAHASTPLMLITTKHGSVIVPPDFPRRDSPDGKTHVCMRRTSDGSMRLLCVYIPPAS